VDRLAPIRIQPEAVAERWGRADSRVLHLVGTRHVMEDGAPKLFEARGPLPPDAILLGAWDGTTVFARAVEDAEGHPTEDLRGAGPRQDPALASLMALARAMVWWHRQHRYCGACGAETRVAEAGFRRRCDPCGQDHHPRVDPAMIVLVHTEDACLLARGPRFPPGMLSTLAGFVEPGESLEDCVVREVKEEVGVDVDDVRYVGSQPWPFPQSLMVGFLARARTVELRLEPGEIEDARWIHRDVLADESRWDGFWVPPPFAIARQLMNHWLAGPSTKEER
jgi:NAD+ diphosphatase